MRSEELFQILSTIIFFVALIHTFLTGKITQLAHKFREGSIPENLFHLFGEVEIVFGFWSAILVIATILMLDFNFISSYLNTRNFTEAIFVFVIMSVCSTSPILKISEKTLLTIGKLIPINKNLSTYFVILFFGPLLGSFITEPAAMTICAYLLLPRFFTSHHSVRLKYATIALLFVNISLGGTLTPFAAPPVLMVANKWGWDIQFMLTHFAPKTIFALILNTTFISFVFNQDISKKIDFKVQKSVMDIPWLVSFIHLLFLGLVVATAHYPVLFVGIFLFFIGFLRATKEYQTPLQLREPLLVGFFLAGVIVLGGPQNWWLEPIISKLDSVQLFLGSIGLTAFTDNAALTYLGTLIPGLTEESKLALVQGSVIGGGLTLIANAPNPAGFGILRNAFTADGFAPLKLFFWASPITFAAALIFLVF